MDVKVKKLSDCAVVPNYHSIGASGFDLHSIENATLKPSEIVPIKTGLAFEIPDGYEIQIRPRSGLALTYGVGVLNSPGTIDSDYRGEIVVILFNFSKEAFSIKKGDRIAQGVICKVYHANLILSDAIGSTIRNDSGFGSTGLGIKG